MCQQRKESNYNSKRNNLTDVTNDDIWEISDDLRNAFHNYQNAKRMKYTFMTFHKIFPRNIMLD